jgi:hypothetical protein
MKASHDTIEALMDIRLEATEACLEEAKEPTSVEMKSVTKLEEVLKEEAAVTSVGTLKKRHGDWHLDVRYRGQPKKRTQGNGESRKKLAVACRGMTRCTIPAWGKGHCCQGRTFRKGRWAKPESITGTGTEILRSRYI